MSEQQAYCGACGRYVDGPDQNETVLCGHGGFSRSARIAVRWKPGGRRAKRRRGGRS